MLGMSISIWEVRACCMTSPFSLVVSVVSRMFTSSGVTISGPIGIEPSKFLPGIHWLAARCQSRAEASFSTVNPAIAAMASSAGMYRPPAPMTMPTSPS